MTGDLSREQGAEDYVLGRLHRGDHAPNPQAYAEGWNEAANDAQAQHPETD